MNFRDSQIEQYIRGRMSGKGLEEFERKMAADASLRRSVQVERAIADTIRRDSMAIPAGTSTSIPAALSAKVSATLPAGGAGIVAGGSAAGVIFGTKIGITILTVVGAIGVVLGVLLIGPLFDDANQKRNPNGLDVRNLDGIAPEGASSGKDSVPTSTAPSTNSGNAASSRTSVPSIHSTQRKSTSEGSLRETGRTADGGADENAARGTQGSGSSDMTEKKPSQEMLDQLRREESNRETPTVKKGSAEVRVEIE